MRKVAIVARSPSSRYLAPFSDSSWEIWALSPQEPPIFCDLPRWDRWYEIHEINEKEAQCPGYTAWMALKPEKVWVREARDDLPGANIFPRQEIAAHFQQPFTQPFSYYNNTVSICMAHAIWEGVDELGVWGADMCQYSEYGTQRPSCEFFLGWAAGAGIKTTVPIECDLLKCDRWYGLDNAGHREAKLEIHLKEVDKKLQEAAKQANESKKQLVGASAAQNELRALAEALNGELTAELKSLIEQRLAFLDKVCRDHHLVVERADSEVQLFTGAREEILYQKQFI